MLMGMHGFSADLNSVRRFIASAVDLVVHVVRRPDAGPRNRGDLRSRRLTGRCLYAARLLPIRIRSGAQKGCAMTRIVIFALSAAIAFAVVLMTRYARAATLRRLAQIVVPERNLSPVTGGAVVPSFEWFLPRAVLRHLRLLNINPTPRGLAAIAAAYALGVAVVGLFAGLTFALVTGFSICLASAAVLSILANRRVSELGALMPGFFDRVRQLLVIGNSLPTAFARALQVGQPRLAAFFAPALRRVANGAGFAESIRQSAEDISLYEMHLFSTAVGTNMRFGGSLTHSLSNLIQFLRKRASIERELRANTALIRSSAWVLGLLPVLVAALIVSQNREYAQWFVTDPTGKFLLGYCIVSQIVGVIVMRSIVRTEF